MPNLIHRILGFPEGSGGRRPQMAEFTGINWNVPTAYNMMVCLPMWEPPGVPCLDLGPLGLRGAPIGTILRTQDTYFGDVYVGDGTARGYKIDYRPELDFGIGRQPFSVSLWYNVPANYSPSIDAYLLAMDNPASSPTAFAGFACSFDNGSTIAFNRGSSTEPDDGFKTTNNVFRVAGWHHFAMSHIPSASGATGTGTCTYYIDGKLNSFRSNTSNIGPMGAEVPLYIGVDDDGTSQPYGLEGVSYFCDLRIYRDALSDDRAAAMFHPDTRWEIYYPPKRAYFLQIPTAGATTFNVTAANLGIHRIGVRESTSRLNNPTRRAFSNNLGVRESVSRRNTYLRYAGGIISQTKTPATVTNDSSQIGVAWDIPGTGTVASVTIAADPGNSQYLKLTNCGFTLTTVPTLLTVNVTRKSGISAVQDQHIKLVVNGSVVGNDKASLAFWTGSDVVASYVWSAAELSALGLTAALLDASNFGVVISIQNSPADSAFIDGVSIVATTNADVVALRDTVSRLATNKRASSDSLGLRDTTARRCTNLRLLANNLGLRETTARINSPTSRAFSNNLGIRDLAFRQGGAISRMISNNLGARDLLSRSGVLSRSTSDSIGLTQSLIRLANYKRQTLDNLGLRDRVIIPSAALMVTIIEQLGMRDSANRSALNLRTVSSLLALAQAQINATGGILVLGLPLLLAGLVYLPGLKEGKVYTPGSKSGRAYSPETRDGGAPS